MCWNYLVSIRYHVGEFCKRLKTSKIENTCIIYSILVRTSYLFVWIRSISICLRFSVLVPSGTFVFTYPPGLFCFGPPCSNGQYSTCRTEQVFYIARYIVYISPEFHRHVQDSGWNDAACGVNVPDMCHVLDYKYVPETRPANSSSKQWSGQQQSRIPDATFPFPLLFGAFVRAFSARLAGRRLRSFCAKKEKVVQAPYLPYLRVCFTYICIYMLDYDDMMTSCPRSCLRDAYS